MAVAFDAKMTGGNGTGGLCNNVTGATTNSIAPGITVGASATILVVPIVWQDNFAAGPLLRTMTWDGVSMTEKQTSLQVLAGAVSIRSSIWTLDNPNTGAKTLTCSWTNASDCYMGAVSFTGANGVDNLTTASNATTITITSTTDGATVAVFVVDGNAPTTNFNQLFSDAPFAPGGGASYQLGGTSNAHTFTGGGGTGQELNGVHVIASGGGGGTTGHGGLLRNIRNQGLGILP